jgi:hypothetical protein
MSHCQQYSAVLRAAADNASEVLQRHKRNASQSSASCPPGARASALLLGHGILKQFQKILTFDQSSVSSRKKTHSCKNVDRLLEGDVEKTRREVRAPAQPCSSEVLE